MPATESDRMARARVRLGTTLRGKYRLDRVLGIGGMATVYAATHRNQKQFAVKILHPELSSDEDLRSRFLREGYAANSLKHPGAVAVLDDDIAEDGAAFLVMELLEGATVEELWERCGRRMPVGASLAIGHQLLEILASAHDKGVVHRDIKPGNLYVTHDGTVKVLDFGIARVRDAVASGVQALGTGNGTLLGTPAFMSPEQALAKTNEIDAQSDLWAVGATLYCLIAGRIVHDGDNAPQVLVNTATVPARSLATRADGVHPLVTALVDRALAFTKEGRWPDATTMRAAVAQAFAAAVGEPVSRRPIEALLATSDLAIAPTMRTPASTTNPIPPSPPPTSAAAIPPALPPGGTLAESVSSVHDSAVTRTRDGSSRWRVAVVVALVLLGSVIIAKLAITPRALVMDPDAAGATALSPPTPTAASPSETAAPPASSPSTAFAPSATIDAQAPAPRASAFGSRAPASSAKPAISGAPTASAAPTPTPNPACNPPYTIDGDGNKRFKAECYK